MTIQKILRLKDEKPFQPYRIFTTDGRSYDVVHPESISQSASGRLISVGLPHDSFIILDLLHVTGIQRRIKARGNGSKRKQ
jgi:hypothetical protein